MSQVDDFHYCAKLTGALPFSVADCPHCTESNYPPSIPDQLAQLQRQVARVRALADRWCAATTWDDQPATVDRAFGRHLLGALAIHKTDGDAG